MYILYLSLTAALTIGVACIAYFRFRDPFHPLFVLSLLLSWPYFLSPIQLYRTSVIQRYLPAQNMPFAQLVFLIGIVSLQFGVLSAKQPRRTLPREFTFSRALRDRIRLAGIILGVCGTAAYLYTVHGSGGFNAVYSDVHGRSAYGSGWVRDASSLLVPGILFVLLSSFGVKLRLRDKVTLLLFAAPLVFQGIIGSSRGVTFMTGITVVVGWYMVRSRRPGLIIVIAGGTLFSALIFLLAAERSEFYLGSHFDLQAPIVAIEKFVQNDNPGQEYIYGAGSVIQAAETGRYQWGALYLIHLVIQPIPHEWWPTKYEDSARYLGIPTVAEANFENVNTMGWVAPAGAAAGMVADMWVQFWWLMAIPLYLIGRLYGLTWRLAITRRGIWTVIYVVLLAHSIFLTQQDVDAMLFKVLYIGGFTYVLWHVLVENLWRKQRVGRSSNVSYLYLAQAGVVK